MKWALLSFIIISCVCYAIPTRGQQKTYLFLETFLAVFSAILAYWFYWQSGLF